MMNRTEDEDLVHSDEDSVDEGRQQEYAIRVVEIIQTVVEDLDESGKRMWRKMLGLETAIQALDKVGHLSNR